MLKHTRSADRAFVQGGLTATSSEAAFIGGKISLISAFVDPDVLSHNMEWLKLCVDNPSTADGAKICHKAGSNHMKGYVDVRCRTRRSKHLASPLPLYLYTYTLYLLLLPLYLYTLLTLRVRTIFATCAFLASVHTQGKVPYETIGEWMCRDAIYMKYKAGEKMMQEDSLTSGTLSHMLGGPWRGGRRLPTSSPRFEGPMRGCPSTGSSSWTGGAARRTNGGLE
jgi:hypothetical protein